MRCVAEIEAVFHVLPQKTERVRSCNNGHRFLCFSIFESTTLRFEDGSHVLFEWQRDCHQEVVALEFNVAGIAGRKVWPGIRPQFVITG